eukprot:c19396_g1_i1 orf=104-2725(+)
MMLSTTTTVVLSPATATHSSWALSFNHARQQQQGPHQCHGYGGVAVVVARCHQDKHTHHHHGHYCLQSHGGVADAGHHHSYGRGATSITEGSTKMGSTNHHNMTGILAISGMRMRMSCHHHAYYHRNGGVALITSSHRRNSFCSHYSNAEAFVPVTGGGHRSKAVTKSWRRSYTISALSIDAPIETPSEKKRVAILWFKKDLRLDDHPGLCASAAYHALLPVYIFDPYLLRGWSSDMLEALVEAVADLKLGLQELGSDLIIKRGSTKVELSALAGEINASVIITEEEIEHEWREVLSSFFDNSSEANTTRSPSFNIETWRAPLYEVKVNQSPCSYKEFQKMRCPVNPPVQSPTSLPAFPEVLEKGCVPSVSVIEDDVRVIIENNIWHKKLKDVQIRGAEALMIMKDDRQGGEMLSDTRGGVLEGFNSWREKYILANPYEALNKRREELAMYSKEEGEVIKSTGVGASIIMGTLDAYLRFLEPTWRKDWKMVHEAVFEAESEGPRGVSFRTLFGNALTLGTLSHRRIYQEAFEYEKARNGGWSSPFGFSTFTAAAAVQEVKSAEWYRMLAAASEEDSRKKGWRVRTWRWRGFLIQYNAMGGHGLPIVLVHGFGAFWEHYRDNIENLAEEGNRVWALTLLGFGRSEKPDVAYTELLWAELIRDFIVEVVGEPAILVGNSIGGYMVSMVAGLWPEIVKSLILLNTSGVIIPDYLSLNYLKPRGRTGVTWAGAQLSLSYLRSATSQLLKKYYCVNPSRVDDWLTGEILRASHDPGAAMVLESCYCLRSPFPLNWFLDRYKGKVYVIQGAKDPLSNSTQRKALFESYCSNAVVQLVDAGHCPHDEIPDKVNKLIMDWLEQTHPLQGDSTPLSQAVQCV